MRKKIVLISFLFICCFSVSFAINSPTSGDGKGAVVPVTPDMKYTGEDAISSSIPKTIDIATGIKDDTTSESIPKTEIKIDDISSDEGFNVESTGEATPNVKKSFPSISTYKSLGPVKKGTLIKVSFKAQYVYFLALLNNRWQVYTIPTDMESFSSPVDTKSAYLVGSDTAIQNAMPL